MSRKCRPSYICHTEYAANDPLTCCLNCESRTFIFRELLLKIRQYTLNTIASPYRQCIVVRLSCKLCDFIVQYGCHHFSLCHPCSPTVLRISQNKNVRGHDSRILPILPDRWSRLCIQVKWFFWSTISVM
jgi:hypothetical protein